MDRPPFRIVLLTKDIHLGRYLEARLSATGCLVGVLHEIRLASFPEKIRYGWRTMKKEGFLRTIDISLGSLWDARMRRREIDDALATILPMPPVAPNATYERHQVQSLNSPDARAILTRLAPDLIVVHATGILGQGTFTLARKLAINIHCGVLPEYRGHASTFWALWNGDVENIGVTVHEVAKIVDTGRVVGIGRVAPTDADTDVTLWLRAFKVGADLAVGVAERMSRGEDPASVPLVGEAGPHYPRKTLTDYLKFRRGGVSPWRKRLDRPGRV